MMIFVVTQFLLSNPCSSKWYLVYALSVSSIPCTSSLNKTSVYQALWNHKHSGFMTKPHHNHQALNSCPYKSNFVHRLRLEMLRAVNVMKIMRMPSSVVASAV